MTTQEKTKVPPAHSLKVRLAWLLIVAAIGTVLDLGSKAWIEDAFQDQPGRSMMIFEPWLEFRLVYNQGTAFSMIPDLGDMRWFFGVFAFGVSALMFYWGVRETRLSRVQLACLGLIISGAAGNGTQRLMGKGVIDFVVVNYPWGGSYPTWNLADAWLVVGVIVFMVLSWFEPQEPEDEENTANDDAAARVERDADDDAEQAEQAEQSTEDQAASPE